MLVPVRLVSARLVLVPLVTALAASACGGTAASPATASEPVAPLSVSVAAVVERPIARYIRVTGTLTAQEQAEVAAEINGRVVATPVERGSRVGLGADLIRIAATDTESQLTEARANAAQIEAGLGMAGGQSFSVDRVPDVMSNRASYDLAESEFKRVEKLLGDKVISQSEFDRSRTAVEAARQKYDMSRNAAEQQFQMLQAARARVTRAQKALADTAVRAPFAGLVAERLVSVGDYVTPGTKVAVVVRVDPLRVELTVPEQFVAAVGVGRPVSLQVDAYPGRTFTGHVRYVSPALTASSRALVVEAVVPNGDGELKPGFFATAQVEQQTQTPALLVPRSAIQTVSGTARVFVLDGDHVEERIVTTGSELDDLVELTSGVAAGEQVVTTLTPQIVDGIRVSPAAH